MGAQTTLSTKDGALAAKVVAAEGAQRGLAEWRERNATYGSQADIVYTATIVDKPDGKTPLRVQLRTDFPIVDANGVITGRISFLGSMIAPANAGEPALQAAFNRGVYALLDVNVEKLFTDREKIS